MDKSEAKLLVVDNDPPIRGMLVEILKDGGYSRIEQTYSGEKAIEVFETYRPHLIIMDTDMGRIKGYEACRQIRKKDACVVIIGLSEIVNEERIRLWNEAGANHFFHKDVPFDNPNDFYRTLEQELQSIPPRVHNCA